MEIKCLNVWVMLLIHLETIDKHGSDPLRWYMITNAAPWDNLKFDIEGVEEARRKSLRTLYNTYSFFTLMPMWIILMVKRKRLHLRIDQRLIVG